MQSRELPPGLPRLYVTFIMASVKSMRCLNCLQPLKVISCLIITPSPILSGQEVLQAWWFDDIGECVTRESKQSLFVKLQLFDNQELGFIR